MITLISHAANACRGRPGQEFGIVGHIRHKVIHLLRRVGQKLGFRMAWHWRSFADDFTLGCRKLRTENQPNNSPGPQMTHQPYVIDTMISAKAIAARIEDLARDIRSEFAHTDKLVVVGLLRGSFVFIADLVRELDLPVEVDFLEASSYGDGMESTREVRILKDLRGQIAGRDVLVVEDIVDTGHTLAHVTKFLASRKPACLKTIALLDKPARRDVDFKADWIGFEIPDEFVVGYGIDFAQRNRNLPFIGKVRFIDDAV